MGWRCLRSSISQVCDEVGFNFVLEKSNVANSCICSPILQISIPTADFASIFPNTVIEELSNHPLYVGLKTISLEHEPKRNAVFVSTVFQLLSLD